MHVQLAPGERIDAAVHDAARALLAQPDVAAVLVPLRCAGEGALARAARRLMDSFDLRHCHAQSAYAWGSRVATRAPLPGPLAAHATPHLLDALDEGRQVAALREGRVETPIARDLGAWARAWRREGEAWGRAARDDTRLDGFAPGRGALAWARHNAWHAHRRAGEALQAVRAPDPLAAALHVVREAAWTGAYVRARR